MQRGARGLEMKGEYTGEVVRGTRGGKGVGCGDEDEKESERNVFVNSVR